MLRGLNETFYHQTVTTQEIETYMSEFSGLNLTAFFNQYLRDVRVPTLEYSIKDNELSYRWINIVDGFQMPIEVEINEEKQWLYPTADWKKMEINSTKINIDRNFYIDHKQLN